MRKLAKGVYFVDRQGARPQSSTDPDVSRGIRQMDLKLTRMADHSDFRLDERQARVRPKEHTLL
jgi:hypothetical protein